MLPACYVGGEWRADNNFTQETTMTMITPSAQLTLPKGNKSWSSTAVAAALELVDPLGSGPWLSLTAAAFFFFFFFFLFFYLFFFFFFFFSITYTVLSSEASRPSPALLRASLVLSIIP
eukprot:FR744442.1.p1 GENE.FR744442.1~~FR744442.1.p1  ORF type:complete len:119 (-),score=52.20 FR744442.1:384-740(-)